MLQYSNTFVIFELNPNTFSFSILRKIFTDLGLEEKELDKGYSNPKFVWFRYINTIKNSITHMYSNIPIYCINMLDGNHCITDKYLLYACMKKLYPKEVDNFMAKSFKLTLDTEFNPGDLYITRPVNDLKSGLRASSGLDVNVYNDIETLEKAKKLLTQYDNIIASKYITNPLLFHGKKFHFRAFMIITLFEKTYSSYMLDIFKIITSKSLFINDNYQNKDIHDTHYRYNVDDYLFPLHFTSANINKNITQNDIQTILDKIKSICYKMSHIFSTNVKLRPNSENGFHLFGFDIMLDENLNPILIECNRFLNLELKNQEIKLLFETKFFDWVNEIIIKPLFAPETKLEPTFSTKPLYQRII
jgi:hypothetical protein